MKEEIHWQWSHFNGLTTEQWHDLLELRINVFVVEQNCPYPELDGKDPECIHVWGERNERVVAVARILPPGLSYQEVSLGRVATLEAQRGQGLGKKLMDFCLQTITAEFGRLPIRISAQTYLIPFYRSLGFEETGKEYLEDDIPHVQMYRAAP